MLCSTVTHCSGSFFWTSITGRSGVIVFCLFYTATTVCTSNLTIIVKILKKYKDKCIQMVSNCENTKYYIIILLKMNSLWVAKNSMDHYSSSQPLSMNSILTNLAVEIRRRYNLNRVNDESRCYTKLSVLLVFELWTSFLLLMNKYGKMRLNLSIKIFQLGNHWLMTTISPTKTRFARSDHVSGIKSV